MIKAPLIRIKCRCNRLLSDKLVNDVTIRNKEIIRTDISSFDEIRKYNAVYVDKTKEIYENILTGSKYYFLVRPRRFGKSLLCSTISNLFGGEKSIGLFKNLWISNENVWDFKSQAHPVIHLDMSLVAGMDSNKEMFYSKVRKVLLLQSKKFNPLIKITNSKAIPIDELFVSIIKELKGRYNKEVVIIIDEYDKPVLDLLDQPKEMEEVCRALQTFYSILKACEIDLKLVFITGLYKFSQMSMFSTLNNITDLSLKLNAGTLCGYTESEIKQYFPNSIKSLQINENMKETELFDHLRNEFNGYRFGFHIATSEISESVYNPFAINYVMNELDTSCDHWYLSGSASMVAKMINDKKYDFVNDITIYLNELVRSTSPSKMTIRSLMYYGGYLTINKLSKVNSKSILSLKFPNNSISTLFNDDVFTELFSKGNLDINYYKQIADDIKEYLTSSPLTDFKNNDSISKLLKYFNQLLADVSYEDLKNESSFKNVLNTTFRMLFNSVIPQMNTNDDRIDTIIHDRLRIFIFEFKFNESSQDALKQIKGKKYFEKYLIYKLPIICFGLNLKTKKGKNKRDIKYNRIIEISVGIIDEKGKEIFWDFHLKE